MRFLAGKCEPKECIPAGEASTTAFVDAGRKANEPGFVRRGLPGADMNVNSIDVSTLVGLSYRMSASSRCIVKEFDVIATLVPFIYSEAS